MCSEEAKLEAIVKCMKEGADTIADKRIIVSFRSYPHLHICCSMKRMQVRQPKYAGATEKSMSTLSPAQGLQWKKR